jgi:hypothetical protein
LPASTPLIEPNPTVHREEIEGFRPPSTVEYEPVFGAAAFEPLSHEPIAHEPIAHERITQEPITQEPILKEKPQVPVKPIATDSIRWTELSYDLGLQGLAQEIATNSVVGSFEQNHLQLFLTRDFMEFVNPANQDEICQAIASKLGLSLNLDLKFQDKLDAETPSETRLRKQSEHRLATIEVIKQEPTVRKLQRAFGAELVESSVRQVDRQIDQEKN